MFCQNLTHFVAPLPQLTFPPPPTPPPSSDETSPSEDDGSGDDDKTESYNPDHVHHNKRSGGSEGGSASKRGRIGTNGTGVGMGRSSQVEVTFGDVVDLRFKTGLSRDILTLASSCRIELSSSDSATSARPTSTRYSLPTEPQLQIFPTPPPSPPKSQLALSLLLSAPMPDLPVQISGPLPVSLPSLCYSLTEKIYETSGKQVWRGYSSVNPELAVILKLFTETEAWRGVREALIYQEIFGRRTCPLTIVPSCLGIYMAPVQGWLMIVLEDVGDPVAEDDVKGLEKTFAALLKKEGVIHCDLTRSNLLKDQSGIVRVIDFEDARMK